jgi:hypothetical protein
MSRSGFLVRALALVACLAGPAAASQNHTVNSRFTSSTIGWDVPDKPGYTASWTNTRGHDALGSLKVIADGTQIVNTVVASQCIGVKELATYNLSGWFRYDSGSGTPGRGSVKFFYYTSGDCTTGINGTGLGTIASQVGVVDAFQHLTLSNIQVPAGHNSLEIQLSFFTGAAATANGYFDDITFTGGLSGDADANGSLGVADVFWLINHLFAGGVPPKGPCDVNNSDTLDVTDVFYLINHLFAGGPAPQ